MVFVRFYEICEKKELLIELITLKRQGHSYKSDITSCYGASLIASCLHFLIQVQYFLNLTWANLGSHNYPLSLFMLYFSIAMWLAKWESTIP